MEIGCVRTTSIKLCAHEAMMQSGLLMSEDDRRFIGFWTIFKGLVKADFGDAISLDLSKEVDE